MADKLKMHIWSTTPAISENIKLLQDKINELIDEIDAMKRAGGNPGSTSEKDLRVCEVVASASFKSKMCCNCKSFKPISRGESFVVLQGKCHNFGDRIVWKDYACDRFELMIQKYSCPNCKKIHDSYESAATCCY